MAKPQRLKNRGSTRAANLCFACLATCRDGLLHQPNDGKGLDFLDIGERRKRGISTRGVLDKAMMRSAELVSFYWVYIYRIISEVCYFGMHKFCLKKAGAQVRKRR
jgi:hypothetical protein